MSAGPSGSSDPVALAERIFGLLDEGSFSATYKYAVLMALLDLCIEQTSNSGVPPTSLTTRQVAGKVLELYWPQCLPWEDGRGQLRQGGNNEAQQAEVLRAIIAFREQHAADAVHTPARARLAAPDEFAQLLDLVEWKLIEMPLPRLQFTGAREERFLYEYGWTRSVRRATVRAYQRGDSSTFDNVLRLQTGVAEGLIRLNTLLRPLIRREWLRMVQLLNSSRLAVSELERWMFDREREALGSLQGPLRELQQGRCFYCDSVLGGAGEVDHFIPWVRYPNNALENLVLAHPRCNNNKRDFLPAGPHVARWVDRQQALRRALDQMALTAAWESAPDRSLSIAVALYQQLPASALLWREVNTFVPFAGERAQVETALRRAA